MKKTITLLLCCLYFYNAHAITSSPTSITSNQTEGTIPMSTLQTEQKRPDKTTLPPCPSPSPTTVPSYYNLLRKEHLFMAAGGLIIVCTTLLISTLLLAWKVCQLSRRLKMLSGHSDLMTTAKSWKESSKNKDNKSETDAKETTVLMSNLNEACDEAGDDGNQPNTESVREEKENVCENGMEQKEKGAKNEEVKETSAAVCENSSSPQEEGTNSQANIPKEADATEGEKGTKDEV